MRSQNRSSIHDIHTISNLDLQLVPFTLITLVIRFVNHIVTRFDNNLLITVS